MDVGISPSRGSTTCDRTPSVVTRMRGKPSSVQEQTLYFWYGDGRSLEVMSNHDPREMVIGARNAPPSRDHVLNRTRLTVPPETLLLNTGSRGFFYQLPPPPPPKPPPELPPEENPEPPLDEGDVIPCENWVLK